MRTPTIRDVARAANVSVATVSRALNKGETVADATRHRVLHFAGTLDYVPHSGARSLATRRTDTIGVLLPDLHGAFFSELIRGLDLGARAHRLHLLLSHSHGDPAEAAAMLRAMRSRVDAMVVMSPYADTDMLSGAANGGVPMVLLSSGAAAGKHPTFSIDNHAGALAVTNHLLDAGHRRIAFIAGPRNNIDAAERLRGYHAALAGNGDAATPLVVQGDFGEASGLAAGRRLIADGVPDAIFAANDIMAIGCLQAMAEAGLDVPGDVALAGFDDIPVSRFLAPSLTTVAVPIAAIGREALECCIALLAGRSAGRSREDAHRIFKPALVVRNSTAGTSSGLQGPDNQQGEDRWPTD